MESSENSPKKHIVKKKNNLIQVSLLQNSTGFKAYILVMLQNVQNKTIWTFFKTKLIENWNLE